MDAVKNFLFSRVIDDFEYTEETIPCTFHECNYGGVVMGGENNKFFIKPEDLDYTISILEKKYNAVNLYKINPNADSIVETILTTYKGEINSIKAKISSFLRNSKDCDYAGMDVDSTIKSLLRHLMNTHDISPNNQEDMGIVFETLEEVLLMHISGKSC